MSQCCGLSLSTVSLITLALQNSFLILLMRYTRTLDGPLYLPSTAVFLSELMKLIISIAIFTYQRLMASDYRTFNLRTILRWLEDLFGQESQAWKLSIPAVLYTVQNNLLYLAVTLLDAATFQVTYQLKILTTAFFSVLMLNKRLQSIQWLSLCLLTVGVALVQLPSSSSAPPPSPAAVNNTGGREGWDYGGDEGLIVESTESGRFTGLLFVFLACCISGVAGVYFERILKHANSPPKLPPPLTQQQPLLRRQLPPSAYAASTSRSATIWERNIQMAAFSVLIAAAGCLLKDGGLIRQQGFWHGYHPSTILVIFSQASGGLLIAMVVRYADNILKGFATSISIIFSSALSAVLFEDFQWSVPFVAGSTLVIASTFIYDSGGGLTGPRKSR